MRLDMQMTPTPLSPNCPLLDGDVRSSIWPAVRPAGGAADGAGGS